MFEPSDSQEAKDFIKLGFEVSEKFDTPVMVRSVTRISHAKGIVELQDPVIPPVPIEIKKDTAKYTMLPSFARIRHAFIEERFLKLKEFAEQFPGNRMEINDPTDRDHFSRDLLSICKGSLSKLFVPQTGYGMASTQKFDWRVL